MGDSLKHPTSELVCPQIRYNLLGPLNGALVPWWLAGGTLRHSRSLEYIPAKARVAPGRSAGPPVRNLPGEGLQRDADRTRRASHSRRNGRWLSAWLARHVATMEGGGQRVGRCAVSRKAAASSAASFRSPRWIGVVWILYFMRENGPGWRDDGRYPQTARVILHKTLVRVALVR
jgi:hypothetical protein